MQPSTTMHHVYQLPFLVPSCRPSKELDVWVTGQAMMLKLSKRSKDASRQCFQSSQWLLVFTPNFDSFTIHLFKSHLVTSVQSWYASLATIFKLWHEHGVLLLLLYLPGPGEVDGLSTMTILMKISAQYMTIAMIFNIKSRIRRLGSLANIQEGNWQAPIERFLQINFWKTNRSISINSYISATPTSWVWGGLYCLGGGGWLRIYYAGIQEGIRLRV